MSEQRVNIEQFDGLLKEGSDVAAVVTQQWFESVEGKDAIIFPPTYAKPERVREGDWLGYNLDLFEDGSSVCQIDSVGSQANRMEPLFKREPYRKLVPRVVVKAGEREVDLLDAGHRAADAIVRFSDLWKQLKHAFIAAKAGDAEDLAKIAPTSLVFGAWDSRDTQVKLPRIVRSVIRAFGVKPIHRSAQYIPPVEFVNEGLIDAPKSKTEQDSLSQLGLAHAPAPWTHGGVQVVGEIRRDAALNLVALRTLGVGKDAAGREARTLTLRRYVLGLALVCFTAPQETFLREGCQITPDTSRPSEWLLVHHDGRREHIDLSHVTALAYAQLTATAFGVGQDCDAVFNAGTAKEALGQSKEERKKSLRGKGQGAGEGLDA